MGTPHSTKPDSAAGFIRICGEALPAAFPLLEAELKSAIDAGQPPDKYQAAQALVAASIENLKSALEELKA